MTIVLPFRASLSLWTVFSASVKILSVDSISLLTVWTPHDSSSCFSTSTCEVSATIGRGGLYFETRRAVFSVWGGGLIGAAGFLGAGSHSGEPVASPSLFFL